VDRIGVEGEGSNEEADQLNTSDDIMQGEVQVAATIPGKTVMRAAFDESRPSSLEVQLIAGRSTKHY
jgi:hypothetical protein